MVTNIACCVDDRRDLLQQKYPNVFLPNTRWDFALHLHHVSFTQGSHIELPEITCSSSRSLFDKTNHSFSNS